MNQYEFSDLPRNVKRTKLSYEEEIDDLKQKLSDPNCKIHFQRKIQRRIKFLESKINSISDTQVKFFFHRDSITSAPPHRKIGHCIAEDCGMGAGAALALKQEFGDEIKIVKPKAQIGTVVTSEASGRVFLNLVTKKESGGKPTFRNFRKAIIALKNKVVNDNITSLSITKLGSGLDKLSWDGQVFPLLFDTFRNIPIIFHVYYL
jgi:hypothetical protein